MSKHFIWFAPQIYLVLCGKSVLCKIFTENEIYSSYIFLLFILSSMEVINWLSSDSWLREKCFGLLGV